MRAYEPDSPRACARLLALSMIVDGDLDPAELKVLDDGTLLRGLGLDADVFHDVLGELCSDMLRTAVRGGAVELTPARLDALLAEVTNPDLRQRLLAAMVKIVAADARVTEGEGILLERAGLRWGPVRQAA